MSYASYDKIKSYHSFCMKLSSSVQQEHKKACKRQRRQLERRFLDETPPPHYRMSLW